MVEYNSCRFCFAPYQVLKKCGIKSPMPIPIVGNYLIFKMVSRLKYNVLLKSGQIVIAMSVNRQAMTYNILVSCPLKCHLPMQAGGYYLLCYYILFCTKPAYLTARAWQFSIYFNDNNFRCGTKKYTWAGDGNYYITSHGLTKHSKFNV